MFKKMLHKRRIPVRPVLILALSFLILPFFISSAYAVLGTTVDGVMLGGLGVPGFTTNVYNQSGVGGTLLPLGCVVQFIEANGSIHAPNADGTPGGGDTLIYQDSVGYATFAAGTFDFNFGVTGANGTIVYFRAWNAATIAAATYYGNSTTHATSTATDPLNQAAETWSVPSFATTTSVVPVATISSITPNNGTQGATINSVAIVGANTHFVNGTTTVSFGTTDITVSNVSVTSATALTCNIVISASAATGAKTVTVTTGSETPTGTFTINAVGAPTISSITPNNGNQGATIPTVTIVGTNTHFDGTTTVSFGSNVTVGSVSLTDATHLTCNNVVIDGTAATGARNVVVTTPGVETVTGTNAFMVNQNTSITPPPGAFFAHGGGIMMAYPNPFNPNDKANPLKMLFQVTAGDTVNIYIFDANGRIIYQDKDAQTNLLRIVTWDGESSYGGTVNNGLYLIMVVNNGKLVAKAKILVVKK
jgi:hypothetical protein